MNLRFGSCRGRFAVLAAVLTALLASVLLPCPTVGASAPRPKVKYSLKVDPNNPAVVEVSLTFRLYKGENVLLSPSWAGLTGTYDGPLPEVEIVQRDNPGYQIEAAPEAEPGWVIIPAAEGEATVPYRVRFDGINAPRSDPEAPGGALPPQAISDNDLKVFKGSDVLMCPRRVQDRKTLSSLFQVDIALVKGEKALVPWKELVEGGASFEISSERSLLENYMSWGRLEIAELGSKEPRVVLGFSRDYDKQTVAERKEYEKAVAALLDELTRRLHGRGDMENLSILACSAGKYGLKQPAYETLLNSMVLFHGGSTLSGTAAAAAAGGLFELWNGYSMLPAEDREAKWFQEGLRVFYPLRVAAIAGLMDSREAYEEFSKAYRLYLTDPLAGSTSLVTAEKEGGAQSLLRSKGSAVVGALSKRLQEESRGSVKDIDWLLGRISEQFNHFDGEDYDLVDISEQLEEATGDSWDRFFAERVRGTGAVLSSEFSTTELFGATTGFGKVVVVGKGSGTNWIYLLIAILIIFSIPVIFSAYIRRAVKLDMTMPNILPDDDDEGE